MVPTVTKVLRVRVRDRHAALLRAMAAETNAVWNYCNELSERSIRERRCWLSGFDLQKYTDGACHEFALIGSATTQQVSEEYATRRRQARRTRLRWRKSHGERRSLGWVPFKVRAARWKNGQVRFAGHHFKVWDSYGLAGYDFRAGCFSEDARGRWYFCICVEVAVSIPSGQDAVGIDLGLRTVATCSDGTVLEGGYYRALAPELAAAQRTGKKGRARAINATIRHRREDAQHKFTTALVARCGEIYVGDVSAGKLVKGRMAKSVHDAGWARLRTMLEYKSRQAGIVYEVVHEAWTTRACSDCGAVGGPRGLEGLGMRAWECAGCGAQHERDVNAARNILALGRGHAPLGGGIPCLQAG